MFLQFWEYIFLQYCSACSGRSNVNNYVWHFSWFNAHILVLGLLSSSSRRPCIGFLTIKFALDVRRDPQLNAVLEAIHFTGEVFGELE